MNYLFNIFGLIIFLGLIVIPFLTQYILKNRNNKSIFILPFSLVSSILISLFFVYWEDSLSKEILLDYYNFNNDGLNEYERLENVKPINRRLVLDIYNSTFGIGWPLKYIFFVIGYIIPYHLVFMLFLFLKKYSKK